MGPIAICAMILPGISGAFILSTFRRLSYYIRRAEQLETKNNFHLCLRGNHRHSKFFKSLKMAFRYLQKPYLCRAHRFYHRVAKQSVALETTPTKRHGKQQRDMGKKYQPVSVCRNYPHQSADISGNRVSYSRIFGYLPD